MRTFLTFLLFLAGVPTFAAAESTAPVDLRAAVPDDAIFVAMTADAPTLVEGWKENPLAQMWADPQIQRFFAPLRSSLEIDSWDEQAEEEFGYTVGELIEFLTGEVVLYYPAEIFEMDGVASGTEGSFPEPVILADIGERADEFEELTLHLDEQSDKDREEAEEGLEITRITREFRDVTLHIALEGEGDEAEEGSAWTVFGTTYAEAPSPELLEIAVNNVLEGGAEQSLTDSDSFRTVAGHLAGADLAIYANLDRILPFVRELIVRESSSRQGADSEADSPAPAIPPELIFDALGLDVMQAGFFTLDLDSDVIAMDGGMSFSENRGLMEVVAYIPGGAPQPGLIPGNAVTFSAGGFDFGAAWAATEKIFNAINPAVLPMAAAQVQAAAENAGVELDLRRDLLDNLGTEFFSAATPLALASADQSSPAAVQSQVIGVRIRQKQGVELAIETLKAMAGQGSELFETRDFLGTQIHSFAATANAASDEPGNSEAFSYALTDSHLLVGIGSPSALEAVLVRMQKPGDSVWDESEVQRALASLPAGAAALQYQDLASTGHTAIEMMAFLAGSGESEGLEFVDPSALPSKETLAAYLGAAVSGVYRDESTLLIRMRLLPAVASGDAE